MRTREKQPVVLPRERCDYVATAAARYIDSRVNHTGDHVLSRYSVLRYPTKRSAVDSEQSRLCCIFNSVVVHAETRGTYLDPLLQPHSYYDTTIVPKERFSLWHCTARWHRGVT